MEVRQKAKEGLVLKAPSKGKPKRSAAINLAPVAVEKNIKNVVEPNGKTP
jgi:hypothetical protein